MIRFDEIPTIFLVQDATDLRKGIDGYTSTIQDLYHLDPFQNTLFLFCNRQHNKLKCLYWDGTGFWLLYKRLDNGHFKWPSKEETTLSITHQQLRWLLEGLKIEQKNAIQKSSCKYV